SNVVRKLAGNREARIEPTQPAGEFEIATKEAAFEAFWEKWPRKQMKLRALGNWKRIPISEYIPLMAGLEKWLKSDQWRRGVIPHAATWLNEKRWQDEDIAEFGKTNGAAPVLSDELKRKRSSMTPEGKLLLEKAGGLIQ